MPSPQQQPIEPQTSLPPHHKKLPAKVLLVLALTVVSMPLGNVMLGMGMQHAGALHLWPMDALMATALRVFSLPVLWVGIALLISWFATYSLVLSWADYSFVQPITSLGYGVTALLGWLMLGEHIAPLEWLGIAVICSGVFVVSRTPAQTSTYAAEAAPAPSRGEGA